VAEICPFRGVRYNQELAKDLADVICPPYDIISPQQQQELYRRSEYNFIRVESGRELPQDTSTDNKYTRSAATLERWLEQGVLATDKAPAIYLHDHYFQLKGKEYKRRGIIANVRLEEWDRRVVRPHEGTLVEHTNDRLSLLWALQANTSPILALFEEKGKMTLPELGPPVIDFSDTGGERHQVWAITRPEVIDQICHSLARQPLYIADGHHRYEGALAYQRERHACSSSVSADDAFNFVMMELVAFSDPGLLILPPHRLVGGISKASLSRLTTKLESFFDIEKLALDTPDVWQRVDRLLGTGEKGEIKLALFGPDKGHLLLLTLRDFTAASQMMPYFHSELYRKLDVSVLDHVILGELLGLGSGAEEAILAFSYDGQDAVNRVLEQEYQLAFLLRPLKAEVIKAIADADDRMPRKSTYFFPKAPAGLILHRLA
jgi:uncharacterized protein (DUF1015 family)